MAGFPSKAKGNLIGDKAKSPRPGVPLDKPTMIDLITRYKGNLSRVADAMGTTRYTVRDRCNADPELMKALDDARERRIDALEDAVHEDAVEMHDATMRIFLLKTLGKHRGYEQDEVKNAAQDIAKAAFDFILNKSKNPAEPSK